MGIDKKNNGGRNSESGTEARAGWADLREHARNHLHPPIIMHKMATNPLRTVQACAPQEWTMVSMFSKCS